MARALPAIDPSLPYSSGHVVEKGASVEWVWTCPLCPADGVTYQRLSLSPDLPPLEDEDALPRRRRAHRLLETMAMTHTLEYHR